MALGIYTIYTGSKRVPKIIEEMKTKDTEKYNRFRANQNGKIKNLFALRINLASGEEVTVDYHESQAAAYRQALKNARGRNYHDVRVNLYENRKISLIYEGPV